MISVDAILIKTTQVSKIGYQKKIVLSPQHKYAGKKVFFLHSA